MSAIIAVQLNASKQEGAILISPVVYAELLAHPNATQEFVDSFLESTGIQIDFHLSKSVWIESGRRFAQYAKRRRRSIDEGPRRLLADFIIGAHALLQADRLMTFDPTRFKQDFPELRLYP